MECFVIIVNGWKPLIIITKHSIWDVAAALYLFLTFTFVVEIIERYLLSTSRYIIFIWGEDQNNAGLGLGEIHQLGWSINIYL